MVQELNHDVDSLLTGWAASGNNAAPALRDRLRLVYKVRKIVTLDFFLNCSKQNGFLHVETPTLMCRGREGRTVYILDLGVQNPVVNRVHQAFAVGTYFRRAVRLPLPPKKQARPNR